MNIKREIKTIDSLINELMSSDLDALEHRVTIVSCSESENRDKAGIHLFEPTEEDLLKAWEEAFAEMWNTIYCHYSNVIQFKRSLK